MHKSLDSYTRLAVTLVLTTVLSIGGLSLFMAKTMLDKIYLIETESHNVRLVNRIQDKANKLIFALQMLILQSDEEYSRRVLELYGVIDPKLHKYIAYEKEADYPEATEELWRLKKIDRKLHEIMKIHDSFLAGNLSTDQLMRLDKYFASIETLTAEINDLHFAIISRKIKKSNGRLRIIAALYGFFSLLALVLFIVLYKLYSRNVVAPIKGLAGATGQLAAGVLTTRMPVHSRTEIGLLYNSFNRMAAKIQADEARLRKFNQELEEKLRERTAALEKTQDELLRLERLATLGQIATSVNHEIKTPLNALSMNLQLLKKELERGEMPAATFALLEGEIHRISDLLDQFVHYARFAPPQTRLFDLNAVVANVADLLAERAERAGVRIIFTPAAELPALQLDENKMIQALINLGMNALEAMAGGGGVLTFTTALGGREALLTVRDTGGGIDPADLARIFDPFFSRKPLGLGFGLAIVQKIIEDHGGQITCVSEVGHGASFTISLPLPGPTEGR